MQCWSESESSSWVRPALVSKSPGSMRTFPFTLRTVVNIPCVSEANLSILNPSCSLLESNLWPWTYTGCNLQLPSHKSISWVWGLSLSLWWHMTLKSSLPTLIDMPFAFKSFRAWAVSLITKSGLLSTSLISNRQVSKIAQCWVLCSSTKSLLYHQRFV